MLQQHQVSLDGVFDASCRLKTFLKGDMQPLKSRFSAGLQAQPVGCWVGKHLCLVGLTDFQCSFIGVGEDPHGSDDVYGVEAACPL